MIIGSGNIKNGIGTIRELLRKKRKDWKVTFRRIGKNIRGHWKAVVLNLLVFSVAAFLINTTITKTAICVVWAEVFKDLNPFQAGSASTQMVFMIKNLTVIPFTFIFEFGLIFYLAGKMPDSSN